VIVWAVLNGMLKRGLPGGIILSGAVFGMINGLLAITVVLVYRANRVVNFAAAQFGAVAAVLAIEFVIRLHVEFFVAVASGLVIAAALGALLEFTILRRFANAPRLIVAVATIGLAQVLDGASLLIPTEWSHGQGVAGTFSAPIHLHFTVFPVVFDANYVMALILVPVALIGLTIFLRYTAYGVAIRASADNGERARLLGVPVARLSTIVWAITGLLSALAVLLRVPILGFYSFQSVSSGGTDLLLQTFTAAVIGGMTSLPVTMVAAIGLGILEQSGAWQFKNATYVDALLLVVILVALLVRRDRLSRAAGTGIATWRAVRPIRPIPAELWRLPQVRNGVAFVRLAVLTFALAYPFMVNGARAQLASYVLIYGIVAASLVVLTGWAGHISLGHVAFMGIGGATMGTLLTRHGWDLFPALLAAALVAGVVALILGIPALRVSGPFLAVVTLAFAITSAALFFRREYFSWFIPDQVSRPVLFGRIAIDTDRQMYYLCLVVLVLVLAGVRALRASHIGRALLATKENPLAAESFALNTTRLNLTAFVVSGALAGLAGGLYTLLLTSFSFSSFTADNGLILFTMVVIGGLGSLPGAVLGAIYVYGVQYLLPGAWTNLATGGGLVLLLLFLPGGLGELVYRIRDQLLRLAAQRYRVHVPSLVADSLVPEEEDTRVLIASGLGGS
jgi:branched-chain amino acid transport system permease protein